VRKITLICFGKLKTPGLEASVGEFTKRLSRYVDFETFELKPIPVPEKTEAQRSLIADKEASLVTELIESPGFKSRGGKSAPLWCLDETGKAIATREWASNLKELGSRGSGELVFLIGGSLGISDSLLRMSHKRISFGPQTLSHELARLVLVEQLYRALSYLKGHPYHNEG